MGMGTIVSCFAFGFVLFVATWVMLCVFSLAVNDSVGVSDEDGGWNGDGPGSPLVKLE